VAIVGVVVAGAFVGAGSGPIWLVPFIPFAGVGALLAIRRPRTSIGWILIGLGWSFAILMAPVQATAQQLADGTADLPSVVLAVAQGGGGPAAFFLFALLAVVFPSGGLPTGRWGMLARAALGFGLTIVVAGYLMPVVSVNLAGSQAYAPVRNPIALVPDLALWRLVTPDDSIFPVMLVMVAAAVSLIVRVRRARGTERQQLRWFATSLAFVVLGVGTGFAVGFVVPGTSASGLAWIPAILAFTSVPVAVGIAVLRYRLYDIDRIISRTLAYAVMTAILAILFAGIVVGLQALFATFTGGSTLAVAASTLVVAALFQPLRQRIQRAVDHRFNRARYDAEQTVAGFSVRMRDEMDISTVAADLHGTVLGAVNPSSLGLWIREARP
jgi:MFS family permease